MGSHVCTVEERPLCKNPNHPHLVFSRVIFIYNIHTTRYRANNPNNPSIYTLSVAATRGCQLQCILYSSHPHTYILFLLVITLITRTTLFDIQGVLAAVQALLILELFYSRRSRLSDPPSVSFSSSSSSSSATSASDPDPELKITENTDNITEHPVPEGKNEGSEKYAEASVVDMNEFDLTDVYTRASAVRMLTLCVFNVCSVKRGYSVMHIYTHTCTYV